MIKAVTFDLDDTLWAVDPVIEHANRTLWQWLDANAPAFTSTYSLHDLSERSPLRADLLSRYPGIAHSVTQIRLKLLEECLKSSGYSEQQSIDYARNAFEAFIHARHEVELFAHARTMLEALRDQGMMIGALSNGNAEVKRTGLADVFDFQYNADHVGQAKPHPLMFEKALHHMQLSADQVIHVGDHPINDVQAAQNIGMRTIWVNINQVPWPGGTRADFEVVSLDQIVTAVVSLAQKAGKRHIL
ncbi:HAD family hydrolase [Nitrincola tibetensis]|jgi:HAD superfamily hydrolase (TIGR01509 family)|uniref:HAD family hydrolase n=1 Tax=Nitrincola tibetensis TaxID=2219697 RepID=A0A364NP58_9GAMM|nr:HAD family hydrolase [Nitrincola tibetensis]RAU18790.1 HAD family hydrolase [Nitrincola tibetensis]